MSAQFQPNARRGGAAARRRGGATTRAGRRLRGSDGTPRCVASPPNLPARPSQEEITAKNAELRRQGDDPVHGITKFADWTRDEFLELFKPHSDEALPAASVALPRKSAEGIKMHDWREQNVVTPVKDQVRVWFLVVWAATLIRISFGRILSTPGDATANRGPVPRPALTPAPSIDLRPRAGPVRILLGAFGRGDP